MPTVATLTSAMTILFSRQVQSFWITKTEVFILIHLNGNGYTFVNIYSLVLIGHPLDSLNLAICLFATDVDGVRFIDKRKNCAQCDFLASSPVGVANKQNRLTCLLKSNETLN